MAATREMGTIVHAEESALRPLLEGTLQYEIPLYQRRYSWTRREWEILWKAVNRQYEAAILEDVIPSHFLGSFVFAPSLGMAKSPARHRVVDGQQRLTTIMVLLAALRDILADTDDGAVDRINNLYLMNQYKTGNDKMKLVPSPYDRAAFNSIVTRDGAIPSASTLAAAYNYFKNELLKIELGSYDLSLLEDVLVDRVVVVEISTGSSDSVHRIFQTLNSSGVDLDQVDLLRNHFFMLLPAEGESAYETFWRPLELELGLRELDYFLWADLICIGRAHEGLPRHGVYAAWQDRLEMVEQDETSVTDELAGLLERGRIYRRITNTADEPSPPIRAALERAREWGTSVHHPVILKILLDHHAGSLSESDVVESLHILESYLVRRLIAKVPTNNLNRIIGSLLATLDGTAATPMRLREVLSIRANYWPADKEILARAKTEEFYRAQQATQRSFVLRRLEERFAGSEIVNWDACDFTLEHVMPQTLSEEWYFYLESAGDSPTEVHAELLHTIGNVTLTCYNPTLSNSPMARKQQIFGTSGLRMNQQIASADAWNRATILARSDELAQAAVEIWEGPLQNESRAEDEATVILEAAVSAIPLGSWTSYRDLGTAAGMPIAQVVSYLREHSSITGVHRVARSSGAIDLDAPWASADVASYIQLLASEGVLADTQEGPRLADDARLSSEDLSMAIGQS